MNDVFVTYYKKQVLVPKEIADFLELDRKRKQAEERQDRRHLSKGILETVLACGNPHLRPTEAKALKNLLLKNLRAAMAELDERDRYLLTLRYRDELSMEAIGKILGISKTAVSKRLKKLHEMLKGSVISRTLHFFCKFRFTSLFTNVLSYRRFFITAFNTSGRARHMVMPYPYFLGGAWSCSTYRREFKHCSLQHGYWSHFFYWDHIFIYQEVAY